MFGRKVYTNSYSAPISRREFLLRAAAGAAVLYGLGWAPWVVDARGRDGLQPGAVAPEEWGGIGWYDVVTAYVDCDTVPDDQDPPQFSAFKGQVVFLRSPFSRQMFVYLAGRDQKGVVKGYRVLFGMDQHWSEQELNISLGGNGGAQLRYDRETGRLTLWLNGFIIGSLEQAARRFGFNADIQVEREGEASKSRVLEQGLGTSDQAQFYMRGGARHMPAPGGNTRLLVIAHLSIRQPMNIDAPTATRLPWPWPFPIISRTDGKLYVTQRRASSATYRTFAWDGAAGVDLDAATRIEWAETAGLGRLNLFLPTVTEIAAQPQPVVLRSDVSRAGEYAFTAEAPAPEDQTINPLLALTTSPLDSGGFQMAQTVGVAPHSLFIPLIISYRTIS